MKQSTSITSLAAALVAARAEIKAIAKTSENPHFRSKFASLDAIVAEAVPVLTRHGLTVIQGTSTPESDADNRVTAFSVETTILHTSGEWLSTAVIIPLAKADPQGAGSALTYGRRYGIAAALCLSTEDDDDGNSASVEKRSGAKRAGRERGTDGVAQTGARSVEAPSTAPRAAFVDQTKVMPFGKSKGTPLTAMHQDQLAAALAWAKEKNPTAYAAFITTVETMLDDLRVGA